MFEINQHVLFALTLEIKAEHIKDNPWEEVMDIINYPLINKLLILAYMLRLGVYQFKGFS